MLCDLSIIIVNYNVRFFLEYCLLSVRKASCGLAIEIIVIDNASWDDDYIWISQKFPEITFKKNKTNLGFGKANNQGLAMAKGAFVLFLNPDTLVPENAFRDCLEFFQKKEDCGALGVHMIDGKGFFLPESKRSNPTPVVSFYKFSGLEKCFPHSKIFGQYSLGFLDQDDVFPVPILAGAFLMVRHSLLDKTGGFDEAFFMYGEDIDLCYRLQKGTGFKNYFLGNVRILHFKGESSKQDSLYHNKIFNEAMSVFVRKYYSNIKAILMDMSIRFATMAHGWALQAKSKVKKVDNSHRLIPEEAFYLLGDQHAKMLLEDRLHSKFPSVMFTQSMESAQNIILCIGAQFNYRASFRELCGLSNHAAIFWFDEESDALIGSNAKDETGFVWNLG